VNLTEQKIAKDAKYSSRSLRTSCFILFVTSVAGLAQAGGIEGRLIAPDGKPGPAGASISLIHAKTKQHVAVQSGEGGVYRADGLAAGAWFVQVENPDHRYYGRKNIQVAEEGVTSDVDLRAGSLFLQGAARDGAGAPLAGAFVTARHLDPAPDEFLPQSASISGTAGDDGVFGLPELRPGRYSMNIAGPGRGMVALTNFEFMASAPVTVVFPDACRITGRVVDEKGEPVADAGIQAIRVTPTPLLRAYALTGDDGTYTVLNVGEGVYELIAVGTDVQPAVLRNVAVELDGENTAGDLALKGGGGKLTGIVTYGDQPLPVVVIARSAGSQLELLSRADAKGEYVLEHVPPGDYAVSFSDPTAPDSLVTVVDGETATLDHAFYGE
jgi:hypothetical protein